MTIGITTNNVIAGAGITIALYEHFKLAEYMELKGIVLSAARKVRKRTSLK